MRRSVRVLACLGLALGAGALPAVPGRAVAGQGVVIATSNHYYPGDEREVGPAGLVPALVVVEGSKLLLVNAEANFESHSVTEDAPETRAPLFDSVLVLARKSGDVAGVDQLAPGLYKFRCRIPYHIYMYGYLNVVAATGG